MHSPQRLCPLAERSVLLVLAKRSAAYKLDGTQRTGKLCTGRRGDGGGAVLAGAKPVPVPSRVCTCRAGYGDVGCNVPVPMLARGQVTTRNVSSGGWTFTQLDVRPPSKSRRLCC